MEILSQLADVSLKERLANCLSDSFGLELKWELSEQIIEGQEQKVYFVNFVKNEANKALLKEFIQDWTPVYEQLTLLHDYLIVRLKLATKDTYNVTAQLEELMNDVHIPRVELWMDPIVRTERINLLDESIYEKKNISKNHLHYLSVNTLSLQELYELIEQKFTKNNLMNYSISDHTQSQLKRTFETLHRAIHQYRTKQEIEILYSLVDKLEDFYAWLKGFITAVRKWG